MGDFTNLGVVAYAGRMRLCARCPYVDALGALMSMRFALGT